MIQKKQCIYINRRDNEKISASSNIVAKQVPFDLSNSVELHTLILPEAESKNEEDKEKKPAKIHTFLKTHLWECFPILPTINIKNIITLIEK